MHECLLGVREMLCFSYSLVSPSAPSGTLTMLRLVSSLFIMGVYGCVVSVLRRVTGGVYAPQSRLQRNTLFSFYC